MRERPEWNPVAKSFPPVDAVLHEVPLLQAVQHQPVGQHAPCGQHLVHHVGQEAASFGTQQGQGLHGLVKHTTDEAALRARGGNGILCSLSTGNKWKFPSVRSRSTMGSRSTPKLQRFCMSDYRWISPGRPGACTVHAHQRMPGAAPTLVLLSASPHSVIEPRAAPLLNAPRDSLSVRHAWHCRSPAVPSHLLCLPAALCPVTGMPGPSQHSTWGLKSSNPPPLSSLSRSFRRQIEAGRPRSGW